MYLGDANSVRTLDGGCSGTVLCALYLIFMFLLYLFMFELLYCMRPITAIEISNQSNCILPPANFNNG